MSKSGKAKRVISRKVEQDLMKYPKEWCLFDSHAVRYHGPDVQTVIEQARAEIGEEATSKLVLHWVPDPNVGYFYAAHR